MKDYPKYNFKAIEKKWQRKWLKDRTYQPDMDKVKKPFYNLMMFPYPSAEGLHVGGVYTFTGVDTFGRLKKLQGHDVFEPIGLDGFGIHSENYAMKIGEHILDVSKRTEKNFYRQLHEIGNMYDWSRTVETYDPDYYKWTQWIFLKMYECGLAYRKKAKVNWCPWCKTVLSDEQVIAGRCERCDSVVEKKELAQWFFKITAYADRLLKNLDWIDWPEDVKTNQRNWIGKSDGATIRFEVKNSNRNSKVDSIECFTTRPDTLFGATYMVVAPEHPVIYDLQYSISNFKQVNDYVKKAIHKTEEERKNDKKEKTGIELKDIKAVNPATKKEIPIFVADYVLGDYGTGAIMAVPAHDERDFQFARKYKLPIREVVRCADTENQKSKIKNQNYKSKVKIDFECYSGEGTNVNSGFLDEMETDEAKKEMIKWLEKTKNGKKSVDYKLRDWCISRQRYWGPPIPIVWCKHCTQNQNDNSKVKILMVHGAQKYEKIDLPAANIRHWHGWLKKSLEKAGFEVKNPLMPENWQPDYDKWKKEFEKNKIEESSIFIGHSAGCGFLARWLNENENVKIDKLILVAPTKFVTTEKKKLKEFLDFNVSSELKKRIGKTIVITSNKDPHDPQGKSADYYVKVLKAEKVVFKGMGHFMKKDMNRNTFPELLDLILNDIEPVAVPVPEKDLPVKLPPMEDFLPEGKGKGPLAKNEKFVKTKCPVCGGDAERETDVSDPFIDSSWYFFRYPSTEFKDKPFDKKRTKKWLPVDSYIGGKEHTVLHLLYSRFVSMVFKDLGLIDFEEPYKRFFGHGLITKDGAKMSKSKGNVVNPDEMIDKYGADTVRLYLRFVGDFSQGGDWRDSGIEGMAKFVNRLWRTFYGLEGKGKGVENTNIIDKTIKVVSEDIEKLSFNTAVARLMEFVNWINESLADFDKKQAKKIKETLAFVLAPMAPHIAEEFWFELGNKKSIFESRWPKFDPKNIVEDEIELVIQVNGKVRDKMKVSKDISEEEAKKLAMESERVKKHIKDKQVKKVIYVEGRLVNIVV